MKTAIRSLAALLFGLALPIAAEAAAPSCTFTMSPMVVPNNANTLVQMKAVCTGPTASVAFSDAIGLIQNHTTPPWVTYIGYSGGRAGPTYTDTFTATACSPDVPAACSSSNVTITVLGVTPPTPPSCTAQASPASVAAAGGSIALSASCTGTSVGSATWRNAANTVIGQPTAAPYQASVTLPANTGTSTLSFSYQLTACASGSPTTCATSSVTVSQAGIAPPPPPSAPACSAQASPTSVAVNGGVVSLSATCTGSAVGSATWRDGGGVILGQPQGAPYQASVSVPANGSPSSRSLSYQLTACAAAAPATCSTTSVVVSQAGQGTFAAPVCAPIANPATVDTSGGMVNLSATCTGGSIGSAIWRTDAGTVVGTPFAAPFAAATLIPVNIDKTSRLYAYHLTVCATASPAVCSTATVTVSQSGTSTTGNTAKSMPPGSLQGMWWAAGGSESGWGLTFAHQDNIVFVAWYTYDANGKPWWLTATASLALDGTYVGDIYETHGPAFNAVPFDSNSVTHDKVGVVTLAMTDVDNGTFTTTVNGSTQSKAITRFAFSATVPVCAYNSAVPSTQATNYQGMWWAASGLESGWGLTLTHQGDTIFVAWYTYDANGNPWWLVATARKTAGNTYIGDLYVTTGPAFNAVPFDPSTVTNTTIGSVALTFANGAYGTFAATPNGTAVTKSISRFVFRGAGTVCQ